MNSAFVVTIAGGSGSGKSTFAQRIIKQFGECVNVVKMDNYYLPHDDIPLEERRNLNFDIPSALDLDMLAEHIEMLKNGQEIDCPVYDFSLHTRTDETVNIQPKPILIVDGIFALYDPRIRNCSDLNIYVETDADERILRRVRRDVIERGREMDGIIEQYLSTVKPMHNLYVEPTKKYADIILNGGMNDKAYNIIEMKIKEILSLYGVRV